MPGKVCPRGHFRLIGNRCKECIRIADRARYPQRAEKLKSSLREKYKNNSELIKSRVSCYRQKNREKHLACSLRWQKENRDKCSANKASYKAAKSKRIPSWLTKGELIEIRWAYVLAHQRSKETGIKYEVDHIIPLRGAFVSGLHCPQNLQIITKTENCQKRNRFESVG